MTSLLPHLCLSSLPPSLQREQEEQKENRRYENQYEESRLLALERIQREEQRRKEEEHSRAAELRQQMEELKLREAEVQTPPLLSPSHDFSPLLTFSLPFS